MDMAAQKVPGDFHALYDRAARATRGVAVQPAPAERAGVSRMAAEVPGLDVHLDEATHNPVQVTVRAPAGRLSTRAAASPDAAARQFIQDRADLWQLNEQDLKTVDVVSVTTRGLPTVRMVQKVNGVEVFQSDMTAALGADNHVVSVTGQLFHGAAAAPQQAASRAMAASGAGTSELREEEAIAKAAFDLTGHPYKASDFKPAAAPRDSGGYRFYASKWKVSQGTGQRGAKKTSNAKAEPAVPLFERPVRLKDVLFPLGDGQFVHGYFI